MLTGAKDAGDGKDAGYGKDAGALNTKRSCARGCREAKRPCTRGCQEVGHANVVSGCVWMPLVCLTSLGLMRLDTQNAATHVFGRRYCA